MRKFLVFAGFSSAMIFLSSVAAAPGKAAVAQREPVTIKNPANPLPVNGRLLNVRLKEDLRIGDTPGSADSRFADLRAVLVDDQEDIIAFDGREACFKVFNKTGLFLRKFGRKGQGPDEIGRMMGVMSSKTAPIAVMDHGNNRMIVYSLAGDCVARVRLGPVRPYSPVIDGRGNVYGSVLAFAGKPALELVKFDAQLHPVKTLASLVLPKENELPPMELMEHFIYQTFGEDRFVWADNFQYGLNVVDATGHLLSRIERAAKPVKMSKDLLVHEMKRWRPAERIPAVAKLPPYFPASFPLIESIVCDEAGRIYVRTFEGISLAKARFDIFDASGAYVARLDLPENEAVSVIKNGRVYTLIRENDQGNPIIKRYTLSWT